ncbi:MAG: hypothetical protein JNL49_04730, partial [Bacteroidia bacterium]|nr:hypothetical protein [Bacteroidia bacterium]
MKAIIYNITLLTLGLIFSEIALISAKSTTWNGSVSSSYSTAGNWSNGIPDSLDNITINSNAPNDLILIQNQKITNLTINGDTVDLGGYTFEITGTAYFN